MKIDSVFEKNLTTKVSFIFWVDIKKDIYVIWKHYMGELSFISAITKQEGKLSLQYLWTNAKNSRLFKNKLSKWFISTNIHKTHGTI